MKPASLLPLLIGCGCLAAVAGPLPNAASSPLPQTIPIAPPPPRLQFTWITLVTCSNEYTGLQYCTNPAAPNWIVQCQFALPATPGAIIGSAYIVTNPPRPYCLWRAFNTSVPLSATNL